MRYKCIRDYKKHIGNQLILIFSAGKIYSKTEICKEIPFFIIPDYFEKLDKTTCDYEKQGLEPKPEIKPIFSTLLDQIKDTHEKKNHDYGNSFAKSMDEFGMSAAAIRLSDKLNRFKSLIKKEAQVEDESIEDTLLDMAAYAIMTVEYIRCNKL